MTNRLRPLNRLGVLGGTSNYRRKSRKSGGGRNASNASMISFGKNPRRPGLTVLQTMKGDRGSLLETYPRRLRGLRGLPHERQT